MIKKYACGCQVDLEGAIDAEGKPVPMFEQLCDRHEKIDNDMRRQLHVQIIMSNS